MPVEEQTEMPIPAGLFRRLAAMVYDSLLVAAILITTITLMVVLTNTPVAGPNVIGLLLLESFAFFAYFWIFRGQTLGMLAWRLSIVTGSGYQMTFTQALLRYFGEVLDEPCGNCDTCLEPVDTWDGTEASRMALSVVYRTGQRFGVNHLIDVLRGADTERIFQWDHHHLPTYGVGKDLDTAEACLSLIPE